MLSNIIKIIKTNVYVCLRRVLIVHGPKPEHRFTLTNSGKVTLELRLINFILYKQLAF